MIIDCKKIADDIYGKIKEDISKMSKKPSMAIILVGENPSSIKYVEQKKKWAEYVGINLKLLKYNENISEKEIITKIRELNDHESVDGFMVQLPLPNHINEKKITNNIHPKKDIDGFSPKNLGKVMIGDDSGFIPCTPAGIIEIIKYLKMNLEGKIACIIGRSNIVGKPINSLLINQGATVISCNSKTKHLRKYTTMADIIIVATGKPGLLKVDMVKVGATVIDVGFTIKDGKIFGDADTELIDIVGNNITPVPGGVGVLTVCMLMKNVLKAHKLQNK